VFQLWIFESIIQNMELVPIPNPVTLEPQERNNLSKCDRKWVEFLHIANFRGFRDSPLEFGFNVEKN
jgi:hypothetical protein